MASNDRARSGDGCGSIALGEIEAKAPVFAKKVAAAYTDYILPKTRSSYTTAKNQYVSFARTFKFDPWPVDAVWLTAWILHICTYIKTTSLKSYLSGIKYYQELHGCAWHLKGDFRIHRTIQYVKRKYPVKGSAKKLPISMGLLRRLLPLIPGWPCMSLMSHDWRVFISATLIAVTGFLRGGEFLWSTSSDRPKLLGADIITKTCEGTEAVTVSIKQPKARWWLQDELVACFNAGDGGRFDVVKAYKEYVQFSDVPLGPDLPAFRSKNGDVLSRGFMLSRMTSLLDKAGTRLVDELGQKLVLKLSSWRAGGVRSALDAGIPASLIKAMGRWKSEAWQCYASHVLADMRNAARAMWSAASTGPQPGLVVGVEHAFDQLGELLKPARVGLAGLA